MFLSAECGDGVVYFTALASLSMLLRVFRRDFSQFERCFPNGLPFPHQLMSHRGGSLENVENTLPAFRHSARLGVDILEMDVQLTKDDQVVICHDNSLLRLCGLECRIQDLKYEDIPPLLIQNSLCSISNVVGDSASTRIPLLLEVLHEFPSYPMQIDVKNGSAKLVNLVGNYILKYKRAHLTVWGSFVPHSNQLCYDNFGTSIPLFFCARRAWLAIFLYHAGLFSIMSLRESALIVPNLPAFLTQGFFQALNNRGVSVIMFGVPTGALNTVEKWEEARNAGVNGICSDTPTPLQLWLEDSPLQEVPNALLHVV